MAMSDNARIVLDYLKANHGVDLTAADIAEATGLPVKSVNGIVTAALQKKGYSVRTEAQVEVADAEGKTSTKTVKFISLTAEGLAFDPEAPVAE